LAAAKAKAGVEARRLAAVKASEAREILRLKRAHMIKTGREVGPTAGRVRRRGRGAMASWSPAPLHSAEKRRCCHRHRLRRRSLPCRLTPLPPMLPPSRTPFDRAWGSTRLGSFRCR